MGYLLYVSAALVIFFEKVFKIGIFFASRKTHESDLRFFFFDVTVVDWIVKFS